MSSAINDCSGQALESKTPKKCDLQVSELTSSTETGSFSEEERGWLGDIGADFRTLAISLKDTAGGVVDFVQRSAVSVANEIAQLELDVGDGGSIDGEPLPLPWEIKKGGSDEYVENLELQEMIFALSTEESTFFYTILFTRISKYHGIILGLNSSLCVGRASYTTDPSSVGTRRWSCFHTRKAIWAKRCSRNHVLA